MKLYHTDDIAKFAVIYLDGRPMRECLMADEATGWTERHGERLPGATRAAIIRERGDVKIKFRRDNPPWVAREYPYRMETSP